MQAETITAETITAETITAETITAETITAETITDGIDAPDSSDPAPSIHEQANGSRLLRFAISGS